MVIGAGGGSRRGGGVCVRRGLVHSAMQRHIHARPDIVVRFPDSPREDVAVPHAARIIGRLTTSFYIGITERPSERFDMHSFTGFEYMILVAVASSSRRTSLWERDLIRRFSDSSLRENVGRGGEHASAGSPHFVYVVVRPTGLWRRSGAVRGRGMETVQETLYAPFRLMRR